MGTIGVIAGSGLYELQGLEDTGQVPVSTPYGEPSAPYRTGRVAGTAVAFLPRHGAPHRIPPHRVNYRANIDGFARLGASRIVTVGAVGGISGEMEPGTIVILDQILDMTSGRDGTFFDGPDVVHVDFTHPYCPRLRDLARMTAGNLGIPVVDGGVYAATNGPRLESAAEIRALRSLGADVVGMTGMPEAILIREREICLLGLAVVTNRAAGITEGKLTTTEVIETMEKTTATLRRLLEDLLPAIPTVPRDCSCPGALGEASL